MGTDVPWIVAAFGTVLAALSTYIVQSRRLSGKIGTTEADRLWAAAEKMRTEQRDDLREANKRLVELEKRIAGLEGGNNKLARENMILISQVADLEKTNERLYARIVERDKTVEECKEHILQLEKKLG